MTYTENIILEARNIIAEKKIDAIITQVGNGALVVIDGKELPLFITAKLAKIYLENVSVPSIINVEAPHSGLVSQKTDEPILKRRGRPKKANNDRTRTI